MMIDKIGPSTNQMQWSSTHNESRVAMLHPSTLSSMCTGRKTVSFLNIILYPLNLVYEGFVAVLRFFCCFCSSKENLNWKEAKEQFEEIYESIITSKNRPDPKGFGLGTSKLSKRVHEAFKQEIIYAYAYVEAGMKSLDEQRRWSKVNGASVPVQSYFDSPMKEDPVLKRAVEQFWQKIKQNTK